MFKITFTDRYGFKTTERFFNFMDAANYWQRWADLPAYVGGVLYDMDNHENLWEF